MKETATHILDQVTARQAATASARDQAIDLADECNNHRDMLRNCLQWMDQTARQPPTINDQHHHTDDLARFRAGLLLFSA